MTQTMKERLIEAAKETNFVECGTYEVNNWPEVIDAILTVLREPTPDMIAAGRLKAYQLRHSDSQDGADDTARFTAMIDKVREG